MGRDRRQPTRRNDGSAENELLDEVVRGEVPGPVRKMQRQFVKEQTLKVQVKLAKISWFKTMDKNTTGAANTEINAPQTPYFSNNS